jgi:hypothetical protein
MNRRNFVGKAAGVSALAAVGSVASADQVEPGPEICKLRHTKEDGPPCIRIKILAVSRAEAVGATKTEDIAMGRYSGSRWECEYELTRIDGSTVIRKASTLRLGSMEPPSSFGFDLS